MVLKDTDIKGDMRLPGGLCLFGRVMGDVKSGGRVDVMAGAVVSGTVECEELCVEGEIGGDVRAGIVEVREGCVVRGCVKTAFLRMRGRRYELKQLELTGK